jgi:hypothetical protein
MTIVVCKAITKSGEQCKLKANASGFCHLHDPDELARKIAERDAEKKEAELRQERLNQPKFSQRKGLKPISNIIQINGMDATLKNSIWNVLYNFIFREYEEENSTIFPGWEVRNDYLKEFTRSLWRDFYKIPLHLIPGRQSLQLKEIYKRYASDEWHEVYDFVEYILNYDGRKAFGNAINDVLARELSGYRYIGGVITDISSEQEVQMLEEALADDIFPSAKNHLQRALELMSDKKNPDYRNSIKESISAVESLAQAITEDPNATLGKALDKLEASGKQVKIHPALRSAFSKLYGYTSDQGGIRHAMSNEPNLFVEDAKFFLLVCAAFVNYVKSKL